MLEKTKKSIDSILQRYSTNIGIDQKIHSELIRLYKLSGDQESLNYLLGEIMKARKNWLNWHVENQRKWQNSKGINRNHDSFEIRESYIACRVSDDREYLKKANFYNLAYRKPELIPSYWNDEVKSQYKKS